MKKKIENYKRKELFEHFDSYTKPFASITTKLDVTNVYELSRKHGHFYGLMGYVLATSLKGIEEFRVTYENGDFYLSDTIIPSYAELKSDETIGFFDVPLEEDYEKYMLSYDRYKEDFLKGIPQKPNEEAVVWLSCQPWFKASSIEPPFDKECRVTQLIWDKYDFEGGRCFVNLMIFFHHGFVDGYHIGKLISNIESNIQKLP